MKILKKIIYYETRRMIFISDLQELEKVKDKQKYLNIYISKNNLTHDEIFKNIEIYDKFEQWYYKDIKQQKIKILSIWITDYDDIACNAILYKNNKPIANIMESYDETTVRYIYGDQNTMLDEPLIRRSLKNLINDSFEYLSKLPKISKCSKLLQSIYDSVCSSDSSMCHITEEDWNEYYMDDYNDKDIETLMQEIKKYNLEEVLEINSGEYKIIGYGNLQYLFNDDRYLNENNKQNENLSIKDLFNHIQYKIDIYKKYNPNEITDLIQLSDILGCCIDIEEDIKDIKNIVNKRIIEIKEEKGELSIE